MSLWRTAPCFQPSHHPAAAADSHMPLWTADEPCASGYTMVLGEMQRLTVCQGRRRCAVLSRSLPSSLSSFLSLFLPLSPFLAPDCMQPTWMQGFAGSGAPPRTQVGLGSGLAWFRTYPALRPLIDKTLDPKQQIRGRPAPASLACARRARRVAWAAATITAPMGTLASGQPVGKKAAGMVSSLEWGRRVVVVGGGGGARISTFIGLAPQATGISALPAPRTPHSGARTAA